MSRYSYELDLSPIVPFRIERIQARIARLEERGCFILANATIPWLRMATPQPTSTKRLTPSSWQKIQLTIRTTPRTDADIIRHQDDGGIKVGFDNQNRMYLYSHKGTMQWILGGFPPGGRTRLKSRFRDFAQSELSRGRRQCVPLLLRWRTMDPDRSCRCCSARG